jgi:hypothetical protein
MAHNPGVHQLAHAGEDQSQDSSLALLAHASHAAYLDPGRHYSHLEMPWQAPYNAWPSCVLHVSPLLQHNYHHNPEIEMHRKVDIHSFDQMGADSKL